MRLISTLCSSRAGAMKILKAVPHNSIVLFPESVSFLSTTLKPYSIDKNLFIIFNSDIIIDGKTYISMRAINQGEFQWTVRKFKLWHTDLKAGISASKPEPIVDIRGKKSALFICNDFSQIYQMKDYLLKNEIEILMLTANWEYNFEFITRGFSFSMKHIPTLKICMFSNTRKMAIVKSQNQEKRIKRAGYVELTI